MMGHFVVGTPVNGFAWGIFGRDSYYDRRIEAVGHDWVVTRATTGQAEFVTDQRSLELLEQFIESGENAVVQ